LTKQKLQLDHQAVLIKPHCPRVAACTQKNTQKPCDLDFDRWPWNSTEF